MNDTAILRREVELLYRNLPIGQVVSIVNSSLLAWVASQAQLLDKHWIWIWLGFAWAIALIRLSGYYRYQRDAGQATAFRWHRRAVAGAACAGAIWGAGALLFTVGASTEQQLFTAFVVAGMVAGAVPVLAANRLAFRAYTLPLVGATFIGLLGTDPLHLAASAMAVLFLLAALRSADYFHGSLHESLRLESEKDDLLRDVQAAKQAAEQSDRAKTEFLANISHELRTPMNGILGMTELLEMDDPTPAQRELLSPLRQSADELLRLINNLIELSAIEAGHIRLQPAPFVLRDLLADGLAGHRAQAERKQLAFHIEHDPALPDIASGDLHRLRQILDHLIGNAIKFTEAGEIRVQAEQLRDEGVQLLIHFVVRDTGIGMSADQLRQIGEIFSQADGSSTRRHGGTGVGLPIARRLIELMGGRLHVESQPGQGSHFSFTLPFGKVS